MPQSAGPDVYKDLRQRLFFAGLIGFAAAIVVGLVLWASLYRTMGKVTRGIRAVAHGDYGERVPVSGPTEVRALAEDVNTMADSVQASQRALREFLANVSHELKTPLTSIRGFSQAMQDGTLETAEERARASRVIDVESRRLLAPGRRAARPLTNRVRAAAYGAGRRTRVRSARAGGRCLRHARRRGGRARLKSTAMPPRIRAGRLRPHRAGAREPDRQRPPPLAQRWHRPAGHPRRRRRGSRDLLLRTRVPALRREDLPHVFDRFYRSQDETAGSGAGLGLAISREIVRAHGGDIRVEAAAGGGTTFVIALPASRGTVEQPSHNDRPPTGESGAAGRRSKHSVLTITRGAPLTAVRKVVRRNDLLVSPRHFGDGPARIKRRHRIKVADVRIEKDERNRPSARDRQVERWRRDGGSPLGTRTNGRRRQHRAR